MFFTILVFLAVLSLLVFVHELGHFWTATKLGVKSEEFGFGFPPRAFGVYKNTSDKWVFAWGKGDISDAKSTIYSFNYFPLGGFVKIKGENGDNGGDKDSFSNHPVWHRFLILSAGVFMNIILAAFLISFGMGIGSPQLVDDSNVNDGRSVGQVEVQILQVLPDSPAQKAGLKDRDAILEIDSKQVQRDTDLQSLMSDKIGQKTIFKIRRAGSELNFEVYPELRKETGKAGVGIAVGSVALVKYPWHLAIWKGFMQTFFLLWYILVAFGNMLVGIFSGSGLGAEVAGPVGIANLTGQVARMGVSYLLHFAAMLSLNLAVINFLPFPALDGGRVLFLIIEKIKGSPVKRETEAMIHNLGFVFLMVLVVFVTYKDIAKFFAG